MTDSRIKYQRYYSHYQLHLQQETSCQSGGYDEKFHRHLATITLSWSGTNPIPIGFPFDEHIDQRGLAGVMASTMAFGRTEDWQQDQGEVGIRRTCLLLT
jgi:hypothetical protein